MFGAFFPFLMFCMSCVALENFRWGGILPKSHSLPTLSSLFLLLEPKQLHAQKMIGELISKLHAHKLHKNNSEGINCVIFV